MLCSQTEIYFNILALPLFLCLKGQVSPPCTECVLSEHRNMDYNSLLGIPPLDEKAPASRKSCILSLACFCYISLTLFWQQKRMHSVCPMAAPAVPAGGAPSAKRHFPGSASSISFSPNMPCLNLLTEREDSGLENPVTGKKLKGFSEESSLKPGSKDERRSPVTILILSCWQICYRLRQYCWQSSCCSLTQLPQQIFLKGNCFHIAGLIKTISMLGCDV